MAASEHSHRDGPDLCACHPEAGDGAAPAASPSPSPGLSRRGFLRSGVAGTAAGGLAVGLAAGLGSGLAAPSPALAQTTLTADQALKELMAGNQRYLDGKMTSFDHDLKMLHDHTAEKQEPFAAVLSCADSRVPVELVFDQTIGHLFVCRVAGNIATPEIIASLEYGAAVLGVRVVMVLAHGRCGAVEAALYRKAVPGQISALYAPIMPAVFQEGTGIDKTAGVNARNQAKLIAESSPVIADLLKEKDRLKVVAAFYDVANGKVTLLE
ncbi:carbonic anhydrase [Tistlia consotensis]|uniref:carbonic anhydrase n=1 Tax=Tistlia consotensis USBA 355 TaxID=560819 RepID=A0A1Y6CR21_9PROT|nr:carbonic anhydrase [Tistlia consotensis]SMF82555.1 carbonic anhydrase [Tistlia consotensis USBA 355]SNS29247.1 carbonic anhydrase [Tistlia consotensis]